MGAYISSSSEKGGKGLIGAWALNGTNTDLNIENQKEVNKSNGHL